MNGIKLLVSETIARTGLGVWLIISIFILVKYILPMYRKAFNDCGKDFL